MRVTCGRRRQYGEAGCPTAAPGGDHDETLRLVMREVSAVLLDAGADERLSGAAQEQADAEAKVAGDERRRLQGELAKTARAVSRGAEALLDTPADLRDDVAAALRRAKDRKAAIELRLAELDREPELAAACAPEKLRAFLSVARRAVKLSARADSPGLRALLQEVLVGFVCTFKRQGHLHVPATLTVELPGWLAQLAGMAGPSSSTPASAPP
jgi:hypothetical protein